jgi:hypothetical protein
MNFDRNGVLVTTSRPKPVLRKCYRVLTVDSRDRDPTKFVRQVGGAMSSDPGDYVVYLPRPFQKVTRIRLMNAVMLGVLPSDNYIMMSIEGLNRMDETASGADRSGYVDAAFAKILNDRPVVATGPSYTVSTISAVANRVSGQTVAGATVPTIASVAGNGAVVTYTTSAAHNLTIGLTLTITGTTNYNNASVVITAVPTTTTFQIASAQTGATSTGNFAVQNCVYTYQLGASGVLTAGQYINISGLSGNSTAALPAYPQISLTTANTTSIILNSWSSGTSPNFVYYIETANITPIGYTGSSNLLGVGVVGQAIYYNDMSYAPNITYYNPPIATLDRMHITLRRHLPLSSIGATTPANQPITFGAAENSFTFEIEYIDNVFEDVSSFETRLDNADYNPKYQV